MSALTVFYDGREIGRIDRWRQEGRVIMQEGNSLGLLNGMVIELVICADDATRQSDSLPQRIGALVEESSDSEVLIQLDNLAALDIQ